VDELGNLESAVRAAAKLSGLGTDPVVYEEEETPWDRFLGGLGVSIRNLMGISSRIPIQFGPVF
jgi:ClpP class serine protease